MHMAAPGSGGCSPLPTLQWSRGGSGGCAGALCFQPRLVLLCTGGCLHGQGLGGLCPLPCWAAVREEEDCPCGGLSPQCFAGRGRGRTDKKWHEGETWTRVGVEERRLRWGSSPSSWGRRAEGAGDHGRGCWGPWQHRTGTAVGLSGLFSLPFPSIPAGTEPCPLMGLSQAAPSGCGVLQGCPVLAA